MPILSAATNTGGHAAWAVAVAAVALLVIFACGVWALARRRAFAPRWLQWLSHSLAEAGWHASETWAEFADWMRLGR